MLGAEPTWRIDELTGYRCIVNPQDDKPTLAPISKLELPVGTTPCPFCPGDDGLCLEPETSRRGGDAWDSVSLLNRYPVTRESDAHEVIVLSPHHNSHFGEFDITEAASAVDLIAEREHFQHEHGRHSNVFVNHGRLAGSSEPHPHAQVVGLEITNLSELQEKEALCHERCFLCHAAHRPHLVVNGPGCFIRTPTAPMSSYDLLVVLEHGHGVRLDPEALAWGITTSVRAIYALLGPVAYNVIFHLPCFGRATRLVWHKRRFRCPELFCPTMSWTEEEPRIGAPRMTMSDRAGRWVTEQIGRYARSGNEVATELGCDWHTVNDTVIAYGTALVDDDRDRFGTVEALGLDEVLFVRLGPFHRQYFSTQFVDVGSRPALRRRPWSEREEPHRVARATGQGLAGRGGLCDP